MILTSQSYLYASRVSELGSVVRLDGQELPRNFTPKLTLHCIDINRNGSTSELLTLGVFDDTADASLTLYSELCDSASTLKPSKTVLLVSNPGWRIDKMATIWLNANSRVDIDPDVGDARRLRALAQRLTKKEHVNPPFPAVDVSCYEDSPVRALYSFANIDDFARANPREELLGYISCIITSLNIVVPYKRNMLLNAECCGIAVFANATTTACKQCDKEVELRINPRIVRTQPLPAQLPESCIQPTSLLQTKRS
jgi:hypothetical protein